MIKTPMPPLHPDNQAFRMMTDDELEELAESIAADGLLHPITLNRNGLLLDGKCRFKACEMAGVEPRFETFEGDEEVCKALIVSRNIYRASYSPSERALGLALIARLASPGSFWEHRVLPEARAVVDHDDLVDAVKSGTMSLPDAYAKVLERRKEAERDAALRQRLDGFRREQPLLAMQVDEGALTLDGAIARAGEQAAAPLLAEHADAIRFLGRRVLTDILEIGRRLTECKSLLGHGNWLPWLEREFGWGRETTALNFMRVFRMFGANPQHVADLELPANVFYLLAAPSTPAAVREDILERAQHERVSVAEVRQLIDEARPDRSPRDPHAELRRLITKMSRELPDDPLVATIMQTLLDSKTEAAE